MKAWRRLRLRVSRTVIPAQPAVFVIPAKAGIQRLREKTWEEWELMGGMGDDDRNGRWIPAFAGMTNAFAAAGMTIRADHPDHRDSTNPSMLDSLFNLERSLLEKV
jgi:hypothetical protein